MDEQNDERFWLGEWKTQGYIKRTKKESVSLFSDGLISAKA